MKDRHSGEEVIGKELGSSPGKREVRCSAAREMCVSRGYLSSLVPGVATVSTSPHYTAALLDVRHYSLDLGTSDHHLQSKDNDQRASARQFLRGAFSQPQNTLKSKEKGHPPTYIFCFLLHHDKAALCPM